MNDSNLSGKYEVYIPAPVGKVWEALTDASATKHYFWVQRPKYVRERSANIRLIIGDCEFNVLDGDVLDGKPQERLATTFQARAGMKKWAGQNIETDLGPDAHGANCEDYTHPRPFWCGNGDV